MLTVALVLLPPKVSEAFVALAKAQRGLPEKEMLKAQHFIGGSVMSFCIEHVGDLIHRMTIHADRGNFQRGIVEDKCRKSLNLLEESYSFENEFLENMNINARLKGISQKDFKSKAFELLQQYSVANSKLTVYNKIQYYAREAAIYLGLREFSGAISCLRFIHNKSKDVNEYVQAASAYNLLPNGSLKPYYIIKPL